MQELSLRTFFGGRAEAVTLARREAGYPSLDTTSTDNADLLQKFLLTCIPNASWNTFRSSQFQKLLYSVADGGKGSEKMGEKWVCVALWLFWNTFRGSTFLKIIFCLDLISDICIINGPLVIDFL